MFLHITTRSCLLTSCQDGPDWAFNLPKLFHNSISQQAHICPISRWILWFLLEIPTSCLINLKFTNNPLSIQSDKPQLIFKVLEQCVGNLYFCLLLFLGIEYLNTAEALCKITSWGVYKDINILMCYCL